MAATTVTGGEGDDLLLGGTGDDVLSGEGGLERLIGRRRLFRHGSLHSAPAQVARSIWPKARRTTAPAGPTPGLHRKNHRARPGHDTLTETTWPNTFSDGGGVGG